MTTPGKTDGLPSYVQSTLPPPNSPQPAAIPITLQWNVPAGPNGHPGSPAWNPYSSPPQIITTNGAHQWNVQPAPRAYVTSAVLPQNPQLEAFHQAFLKGKPRALGITLIVTSILQFALAIGLPFLIGSRWISITFISGIQYWGPVFYIIAGSLAIAGFKRPSVCLVKGTLALSIMSSIFSAIATILNIVDLVLLSCRGVCYFHQAIAIVIVVFLLIMNLLVFCLTVSLSVFGSRAVDKAPSSAPPVMFVIQNDVLFSMPPAAYSPQGSDIPNPQPPPYVHQP